MKEKHTSTNEMRQQNKMNLPINVKILSISLFLPSSPQFRS